MAFARRDFLATIGSTLIFAPHVAWGQSRLPTLRVLCGYPAGGGVDIVSRRIAEKLAGRHAAAAIVENRSGAAGRIAMQELKQGASDGSVMLITPASVVTMYPHVFRNPGYDPFADATPVSTVAQTAFAVAVGSRVPASVVDVDGLIAWARTQRNPAQCANAGAGSMPHFIAMLASRAMAFELQHIPFRSGSNAMQAVATGEVDLAIATESAARPLASAGKLRVLATTGAQRSSFFREARTLKDAGYPTLVYEEWFGAFMPPRTPVDIVESISRTIGDAMRDRDVRETWDSLGLHPHSSTPTQLRESIRSEHAFWGKAVADFNFTPEA